MIRGMALLGLSLFGLSLYLVPGCPLGAPVTSTRPARQSKSIAVLRGHNKEVDALAFSPDSKLLVSACFDGKVFVWDVATRRKILTFTGHTGGVECVGFSPDGKSVATGGLDGTAQVWSVATGEVLRVFHAQQAFVSSVAFSPDGKLLATAGGDQEVALWDVSTGKRVRIFHHADAPVAFSPNGKTLVTSGVSHSMRMNPVQAWDIALGKPTQTFLGHTFLVESAAFSPDGKTLATGSVQGILWNPATGQARHTLRHWEMVESLAFFPDGKRLVTAGGMGGAEAQLWDVATGACEEVVHAKVGLIYGVSVSGDGKLLALGGSDKVIELWEVASR